MVILTHFTAMFRSYSRWFSDVFRVEIKMKHWREYRQNINVSKLTDFCAISSSHRDIKITLSDFLFCGSSSRYIKEIFCML